jgi:signal transduction histidine kinase
MYSLWSGCWSEKEQSLFCVVHDISDRRRLEQLKQDFIAMISHDLRTPLCSFQFFLSLIASGRWSDLPPQLIRDASNAESEANRLIALVNDLLDIAKMESGKMELSVDEVPVSAIVDRSVKSVMHLAEKHDISFRQTPKEAIVKVNEARIVQVLVNLLSNAIKFAPEKSTVDIKLEVDNDFATLSVADRGMGIAAQEQARIFNRFEQSKKKGANNYASSGLGLAICKAIVEEHGGAIGVVSTPGEGSEFWFTVPLSKQPADQHEQLHVNL